MDLASACRLVNSCAVRPPAPIDPDTLAPGDILADTAPWPVGGVAGRYRADIPQAWRVLYAFGGTTMATAIRAAQAELDRPDLDLVGAEATFCAAIPCGPVAMQVEVLRRRPQRRPGPGPRVGAGPCRCGPRRRRGQRPGRSRW